jgi:hypothetical protein
MPEAHFFAQAYVVNVPVACLKGSRLGQLPRARPRTPFLGVPGAFFLLGRLPWGGGSIQKLFEPDR